MTIVYVHRCENLIKIGITSREAGNRRKEHFGTAAAENWKTVFVSVRLDADDAYAIEQKAIRVMRRKHKLVFGKETFWCNDPEVALELVKSLVEEQGTFVGVLKSFCGWVLAS